MNLSTILGIVMFLNMTISSVYTTCCPPYHKRDFPARSTCADESLTWGCCSHGTCDFSCCDCNAACKTKPVPKKDYNLTEWLHKPDEGPFVHFYIFNLSQEEKGSFLKRNDPMRKALATDDSNTIFTGTISEFKRLFNALDVTVDGTIDWEEYKNHLVDIDPASRDRDIFPRYLGHWTPVEFHTDWRMTPAYTASDTYEHFFRFNWSVDTWDNFYKANHLMRSTLAKMNGGYAFIGTKEEFLRLFERLDRNRDRRIVWEEFSQNLRDVDTSA